MSVLRAETGSRQARVVFPNPDRLLMPGQFVTVRFHGVSKPNAILVPQRAVQQGPKGPVVYVIGKERRWRCRDVKATIWQGDQWLIEEGLRAGERVVVERVPKSDAGRPGEACESGQQAPAAGETSDQPSRLGRIAVSPTFFHRAAYICLGPFHRHRRGGTGGHAGLADRAISCDHSPMVQIEADYPGASAEVVAESVARPIELQLPGIDNLLYFDSTSTNDGHMTLRLTFEIGTDVDIAQVQTQNRQKLAEPQLPPEVIRQGITVKKMSPDLLAVMVLQSDDPQQDAFSLANFAILRIIDNIKSLPGVGDALVFGQQNYSMRLILNPVRMAQLSLTPTDIAAVVREQNRDFPAGTVGREPTPKGTELTLPTDHGRENVRGQ